MTIEERLRGMKLKEIVELYDEAEIVHNNGQLPGKSLLRELGYEIFGPGMELHMLISYYVYRHLAQPAAEMKRRIMKGAGA